ncbi:hypothetical protein PPERSA_08891 [Pseudocohnilembus persalinus]|uniref:Uncharacterized protein n=1 Tax=Pseudocohnilembus persalinus TaxID=266149 RepID=A0A0V0QE75_PSEPJ|nr:hypothetical protein PPERSA_08891 [Pseudocohnilembus persalinus]|eukprot:KRX00498.1 hypothetical protein PPERSA_08891 [Pseudocohnilembus persalinus]
MIVDQLKYSGCSKILNKSCYICGSFNHQEAKCGICNYKPNKQNLIDRINYSIPQKRNQHIQRQNDDQQEKFIRSNTGFKNKQNNNCITLKQARDKILQQPNLRTHIKSMQLILNKSKNNFETSSDESINDSFNTYNSLNEIDNHSTTYQDNQSQYQKPLNYIYEEYDQIKQSGEQ